MYRKRRARAGYGSTCQKLIEFLEKDGHKVTNVYPTLGAWRKAEFDVMRWEVSMIRSGEKYEHTYGCWETITDFLKNAKKYGYNISDANKTMSGYPEFWANEKKVEET